MMIVMEWGIMDIRVMLMNLEIPDQKVEMEGVVKMVMVDYVTTSKKEMFIWILSLRLDLDYTTTSKKKEVSIDFERCC